MHDLLPAPLAAFLTPPGTEWDAPLTGGPLSPPPPPGSEVVDLRSPSARPGAAARRRSPEEPWRPVEGSNNWAVAGSLTGGPALLANDMHLRLMVPNVWYRARLTIRTLPGWDGPFSISGITLPGAPVMVVGSNGRIAWGYTNSYGDWLDLVQVEIDPDDPGRYRGPGGPLAFEKRAERLRVNGGAEEILEVRRTIWGPVIDQDHRGRPRALRWTAHEPRAVNAGLLRLEAAGSVAEAMALAPEIGVPPQNLVVADRDGHIGWTIVGAIPRRSGFRGPEEARRPWPWVSEGKGWDGWVAPEEYPRIVDPPSGLLWTANARVVEGEALGLIGDGGYDDGARAGQIRDALRRLTPPITPAAMLAIQLDDRALFLQRWRDLLLETLSGGALEGRPERAELRRHAASWGGRAAVDSVGYRMVRAFRRQVADLALGPLTASCAAADPRFDLYDAGQTEGPLWALVSSRPPNLLDPRHGGWEGLLLEAADAVLDEQAPAGAGLSGRTWGERNTTRILHPIALAVPLLEGLLGMVPRPLPGDSDMPRFQSPGAGASQRMAVAPGLEQEGYFHMPCGQSGHPLSPHFADGHAAWETGEPSPFLPGPARTTAVFVPPRGAPAP
ncbi:MAG TPA: penicillin acylase family protein [Candidatus Polarisedimenticolia bacterium]|nr:penicillin acylase family protein [Candidatus Polarisedimenticolia bacterium]